MNVYIHSSIHLSIIYKVPLQENYSEAHYNYTPVLALLHSNPGRKIQKTGTSAICLALDFSIESFKFYRILFCYNYNNVLLLCHAIPCCACQT